MANSVSNGLGRYAGIAGICIATNLGIDTISGAARAPWPKSKKAKRWNKFALNIGRHTIISTVLRKKTYKFLNMGFVPHLQMVPRFGEFQRKNFGRFKEQHSQMLNKLAALASNLQLCLMIGHQTCTWHLSSSSIGRYVRIC